MPGADRRRLDPARRRDQLLDVAVGLAAGRDLTAVSVREVATAAGVSEGLLYHYFPTKDALLLAAVQRAGDAMTQALEVAVRGGPRTGLVAGLGAYLDHVQADPTGWRALLQARTGPAADVAAAVEQRARELVLHLLGAREPSPALATALDGWAAMERQVCLDWLDRPALTREVVEDVLLSGFLGALGAAARHDAQASRVLDGLGETGPGTPREG